VGFSLHTLFFSSDKKEFATRIHSITGLWPKNLHLYEQAFRHPSALASQGLEKEDSYERLEFLGDSVLGQIVAEYLFKKYPRKDEGFLTEVRSRIVNGESLNKLARKLDLDSLVEFERRNKSVKHSSMYGDTVEALIAAIYLDHGFVKVRSFVLKKLIYNHLDIDHIVLNNSNFKSLLLEWANKNSKTVNFAIIAEEGYGHQRTFTVEVSVEEEAVATGKGNSKKKAEQEASQLALKNLQEGKSFL
jgi:ribonuclease-3